MLRTQLPYTLLLLKLAALLADYHSLHKYFWSLLYVGVSDGSRPVGIVHDSEIQCNIFPHPLHIDQTQTDRYSLILLFSPMVYLLHSNSTYIYMSQQISHWQLYVAECMQVPYLCYDLNLFYANNLNKLTFYQEIRVILASLYSSIKLRITWETT